MNQSVRAWVESAQRGDGRSWAALVDEFLPLALGAAYAASGDRDAARECAQEAFALAIERLRQLREPEAFAGWLLAIVRSCAARLHRERNTPALAASEVWRAPAADAVLARETDIARVRRALEALREAERLPLVLHYFAELPLSEIAALCELPLSTVKKRMRVARARLREGGGMSDDSLRRALAPLAEASPRIRLFCAVRSGDTDAVSALLERAPELVDAREAFDRDEQRAHRLGIGSGATALLRAIERGDAAMAELLLARGADPNGPCECAAGETPLWTAVVHRRLHVAERLLRAGADPNRAAFAGATPLHVAALRGYGELAELLLAHGADPAALDAHGRTPDPCAPSTGSAAPLCADAAWWTGIRALDLFCPLPLRGVARWCAPERAGCLVVLCELAWRAAREGRAVVWAGFPPAPLDRGDLAHALAELGVAERAALVMASHGEPRLAQIATFEAAVANAGDALLVVFEAEGFIAEVEAQLPELARRAALTLVVAPIGSALGAPASGTPYRACVSFDRGRAARGEWPAIGALGSWSRHSDPELAALAARARGALARGGEAAAALHRWLTQPFFSTAPFSGRAGEHTDRLELVAQLERLLTLSDPATRLAVSSASPD